MLRITTIRSGQTRMREHETILRYIGIAINVLSILAISANWGGGFMAVLTACLLTLALPPLAAIFAFFAAMSAWGWPWYLSLLVFLWPVVFILLGVGALGSVYLWMRHKLRQGGRDMREPYDESIDVEYEVIDEDNERIER